MISSTGGIFRPAGKAAILVSISGRKFRQYFVGDGWLEAARMVTCNPRSSANRPRAPANRPAESPSSTLSVKTPTRSPSPDPERFRLERLFNKSRSWF